MSFLYRLSFVEWYVVLVTWPPPSCGKCYFNSIFKEKPVFTIKSLANEQCLLCDKKEDTAFVKSKTFTGVLCKDHLFAIIKRKEGKDAHREASSGKTENKS